MELAIDKLSPKCDEVAQLLKAIAHPQRLKILCCLAEGEKTVYELEQYCGASQSAVSQFLSKMKLEKLLSSRKEGQYVFYKIENKDLIKLMKSFQKIFC